MNIDKQQWVLDQLKVKGQQTKKELYDAAPFGYYHNGQAHFGAILSRMVNSGKIVRVKKGTFSLPLQKSNDDLPLFK